jgi:transposase
MLSLSPATHIFVALQPVDMRAGFNRLYAHVQTRLNQDPLSGHLFVFTNRLRNRVKILYFDGSGLWVCAKRLERGTFGWPGGEESARDLRPEELQLLLHGLEATPRRNWFRR